MRPSGRDRRRYQRVNPDAESVKGGKSSFRARSVLGQTQDLGSDLTDSKRSASALPGSGSCA